MERDEEGLEYIMQVDLNLNSSHPRPLQFRIQYDEKLKSRPLVSGDQRHSQSTDLEGRKVWLCTAMPACDLKVL